MANKAVAKKAPVSVMLVSDEALDKLDQVCEQAQELSNMGLDLAKASHSLKTAGVMVALRDAINQKGMIKQIRALEGTALGYLTDKDRGDKGLYPDKVIADCITEALMQGLPITGNNFNIIAGRTYVTKNGMRYKLDGLKDLTDFAVIPGIPVNKGEGAIVKTKITWVYGGVPGEIEMDFAVKSNKFMGIDALLGKADRKATAWLYTRLSGIQVSDGDIDDTIPTTSTVVSKKQTGTLLDVDSDVKETKPEPEPQEKPQVTDYPDTQTDAGPGGWVDDKTTPPAVSEDDDGNVIDEGLPKIPVGPFSSVRNDLVNEYGEQLLIMYFRQDGSLDDGESLGDLPAQLRKNISADPASLVRSLEEFRG